MKHKAIEKTSIILLSKSTAILGSVVIAFVSIVTGYLIGVSSVDVDQTPKKQETKKSDIVPADDKRVLEPTTANATQPADAAQPQPQPIKPIIMPKEPAFVPVPQTAQQPVQPQMQKQQQQPQQQQPQQQPVQPLPMPVPQQQPQMQPAPQKQMQQSKGSPARKQQQERSLLKNTQNDMKMPLIKGEAAPSVQPQQKPSPAKNIVKTAPAAKKQTATKRAVATASGKYTIQFGAFPSRDGAENLKKRLSSKNINAYILNRKDPNDYYRVRSGSYPSKDAAAKAAVALKAKTGIDNFVALTGR